MVQSSLGYNLPTLLPSRGSQLGEPFPCVGLPTVDPTFCRAGGWMGEGMSQSRSQAPCKVQRTQPLGGTISSLPSSAVWPWAHQLASLSLTASAVKWGWHSAGAGACFSFVTEKTFLD